MIKQIVILFNVVALLTIFSFYGCGIANETDSNLDGATSTTHASGTTTHTVEMTGDYEFVPSSLTIKRGDSVKWVVTGTKAHEVASGKVIEGEDGREGVPDGLWKTGKMASGSFAHTFNAVGTFPYYCDSHVDQGMIGAITVE